MQARRDGRTFTEQARRDQIIAATIETIAELGYTKASFSKIAKTAGLSSTGLISYHFNGKSELVEEVVMQVYGESKAFMTDRLDGFGTATETLRAYIEGHIEFAWTHRTQMKAVLDIFINGDLDYDEDKEQAIVSPVEEILRWGQRDGEFRRFDTSVMAMTIQRSVEGPTFLLRGNKEIDLAAYTNELATTFELATRK